MPQEKIHNYVGQGWESRDGIHINLSLKLDKLNELPTNEYGEVRVTVSRRKNEDEKSGATHFVIENTYQKKSRP